MMNHFLIVFLSLTGIALLCLLYGFFLEPRWIRIRRHSVTLEQSHPGVGRSILFFSDLHVGARTTKRKLQKQMKKIMASSADVIIFGGDLVEEKTPLWDDDFKKMVIDQLSSLEAPQGKWAIYGNHDVEAPRYRKWVKEVLVCSGFTMLENEATTLVGIPAWGFANTHHSTPRLEETARHKTAQGKDDFALYLVHESDWFPDKMPAKGPGLVLCGHSHHGQVTFFGLPLIRPKGAKTYWRGPYTLNPKLKMFVSSGMGTVHIHARFFARPDVLLLAFVS